MAAFWALLWELDPNVKESVLKQTLRAAMKQKMAQQVANAAKGANVTTAVNKAAEREVEKALYELFGARPAEGYYVMDAPKEGGGLVKSFFGYLYSRAQQALSSATDGRSQASPSDEPVKPNQP